MSGKKPTHKVIQSGLYFSPKDGELEVGAELALTDKQAEKLEKRGMVAPLKAATKSTDKADDAGADVKKVKAELTKATKANEVKDKEIADLRDELTKANEALKAASGVSS